MGTALAGFHHTAVVEIDHDSCETLRLNKERGGIDRLVRLGVLKDVSSATDTCPSFEMHRHDQAVCVWVDHPAPERREFQAPTRFAVEALEKDAETGWWVFPDPALPLLETDSVEELLAFIDRFEREPLPVPSHLA